jgi:hypothetical protein
MALHKKIFTSGVPIKDSYKVIEVFALFVNPKTVNAIFAWAVYLFLPAYLLFFLTANKLITAVIKITIRQAEAEKA